MIRVAVKFCGGCDPAYDRVEYLENIKAAAGNLIQWVLLDDGGYEVILLISGCQTACPQEQCANEYCRETRSPGPVPLVSLKSDEAVPEQVVRLLIEKGAG